MVDYLGDDFWFFWCELYWLVVYCLVIWLFVGVVGVKSGLYWLGGGDFVFCCGGGDVG